MMVGVTIPVGPPRSLSAPTHPTDESDDIEIVHLPTLSYQHPAHTAIVTPTHAIESDPPSSAAASCSVQSNWVATRNRRGSTASIGSLRKGCSSAGISTSASTPLDEKLNPLARHLPQEPLLTPAAGDLENGIGHEDVEGIENVDTKGPYPSAYRSPLRPIEHNSHGYEPHIIGRAHTRARVSASSTPPLLRTLFTRIKRYKTQLYYRYISSTSRRGSIALEEGTSTPPTRNDSDTTTTVDIAHFKRFRALCIRAMIGAVLSLVVLFYIWNVEILWGGEMMRDRKGDWSKDWGGVNRTAPLVTRKWVHSHNDEMHGDEALVLALRLSLGSIEVDTWLGPPSLSSAISASRRRLMIPYLSAQDHALPPENHVKRDEDTMTNRTLFIGHETKDINGLTLSQVYLDPLMARLDENNKGRKRNESLVGLYRDDPTAEVQLVIDMKSDGDEMWPYVLSALQPFLDKGYLTTYNTTSLTWSRGPLIIIGTGNTPLHRVYHCPLRSIFYDAPLKKLRHPATIPASSAGPATTFEWDRTISPMASDKFPVMYHLALAMPPWNPVVRSLRRYTAEAERRGISARWWGFAGKPGWVRRRLWELQREGGARWVNADDLADAVEWLGERE